MDMAGSKYPRGKSWIWQLASILGASHGYGHMATSKYPRGKSWIWQLASILGVSHGYGS